MRTHHLQGCLWTVLLLLAFPSFALGSDFSGLISDRFINDLLIGVVSVLLSLLVLAGLRRLISRRRFWWLALPLFPVLVAACFLLIYQLIQDLTR